jgi:hypothetical protein
MNLVKTYTMFLQYISIDTSISLKDDYVDQVGDQNFEVK